MLRELWEELEEDPSGASVMRRIHPGRRPFDLWVALIKPGRERAFRMTVHADAPDLESLREARGFTVSVEHGHAGEPSVLELRAASSRYNDLFEALVEDVADEIVDSSSESEALQRLLSQLQRWQAFLERTPAEGLGRSEQIGLYGELTVLLSDLAQVTGIADSIRGWTGPSGTQQDFQIGGIAVEVKASTAKAPQHIRITSERQLDDGAVRALYLVHVLLDERRESGETLPDLVERIRELASTHHSAAELEDRLFAAGYADAHAHHYQQSGYSHRARSVFHVTHGFPRLVEADLPVGVGDLHYSVELSACRPFEVAVGELQSELKAERG